MSAASTLPQSMRALATDCGIQRLKGLTIQSVKAITKRPGWARILTRRPFIQARSKAAPTSH